MIRQERGQTFRLIALAALTSLIGFTLIAGSGVVALDAPPHVPQYTPNSTSSPTLNLVTQRAGLTYTALQAKLNAQATQILETVTRLAEIEKTLTANISPPPTLTPTEIAPLSTQVGFSDVELDKLETAHINVLNASLEFTGNGHHYRLLSIWSSALPILDPGGTVLLYQTDGGQPKYLWSHDYGRLNGKTPTIKNLQAPPPGEWNADGRVFFAVHGDQEGTVWWHTYYFIYELRPDGTVISRLRGVIPPGFTVVQIERQPDQTLLLYASDVRGEMTFHNPNCCGPGANRYYKWVADKITNAWLDHAQVFTRGIGTEIHYLTTAKVVTDDDAILFAKNLYQLLIDYEAIEQREAGWVMAQNLIQEAKQTNRLTDGTYIDKIFVPTMARLFNENRTFVPPERVDFSRPEAGFYDNDS